MIRRRHALAFCALTALSTVLYFGYRRASSSRPALRVGDYVLSTRDLELRDQVDHVYNPAENRKLAREKLRKAYVFLQILKDHGFNLSEMAIEGEQERIYGTTRDPQRLQKILSLFHRDQAAYRRVFVLPVLAERSIYYEFFLHDAAAQKESRAKVEKFLHEAGQRGFEAAARAVGAKPQEIEVPSPGRQLASEALPIDTHGRDALLGALKNAKAGDLLPVPIDNGETWLAARWAGPSKKVPGHLRLQCVTFPKDDFGPWLDRERAHIPVADLTSD